MAPREYERLLIDLTLKKVGSGSYANPLWQAMILDEAAGKGGRMLVDPYTGVEPTRLDLTDKAVVRSQVITKDATGHHKVDSLYDFIADNHDDLLRRDHHLGIEPDGATGGLRLSVIRDNKPSPVEIAPGVPVTGDRWKDGRALLKHGRGKMRKRADEGFRIKSSAGHEYEIQASMSEELFHALIRGDVGGGARGLIDDIYRTEYNRITAGSGFGNIIASDVDPQVYNKEWDRVANLQLGKDHLVRQILSGKSRDDIIKWVQSPEAYDLRKAMPRRASYPEAWVDAAMQVVDDYIPDVTRTVVRNGEEYTVRLRDDVLRGTANPEDFRAAMKEAKQPLPDIHGESIEHAMGRGGIWDSVERAQDKLMNAVAALPSEKLSHIPAFDRRYRLFVQEMIDSVEDINQHKLTDKDVSRIQHIARQRSLAEIKKWLYGADNPTELQYRMRYLSPFGGAWHDSIAKWPKILAKNPDYAVLAWKAYMAPEHAGLVVDDQGNRLSIEGGNTVWYSAIPDEKTGKRVKVDPKTTPGVGEGRNIRMQLPAWVPAKVFGQEGGQVVQFDKDQVNYFLTETPSTGPIVQVPVNWYVKSHPTLGKSDDKVTAWALKQILPYGTTKYGIDQGLPSWAREAVQMWRGEEDTTYSGRMAAIHQAMMVDYAQGKRKKMPTRQEAADKAQKMGLMRLMGALVLPYNVKYVSPYQPYVDAYRLEKKKDFRNADMNFYMKYGEEYFQLATNVTKTIYGIPPTAEGHAAGKKYRDLILKHPDKAGLIIGAEGAGEFSKNVYEAQKADPLEPGGHKQREVLNFSEQLEDVNRRLGWVKWRQINDATQADLSDRGLTNINDEGAEDLKQAQEAFLNVAEEKYPEWHKEFMTVDRGAADRNIRELVEIASDRRLRNRDDIRGLAEYLILRDQTELELARRAAEGGAKTLRAKANADLAQQFNDSVFALKDSNLSFGDLWTRFLSHDHKHVGADTEEDIAEGSGALVEQNNPFSQLYD
jgi:hypothetical protein